MPPRPTASRASWPPREAESRRDAGAADERRRWALRSATPLPGLAHPEATELAVPVRAGDLVLGVLDMLRSPAAPVSEEELSLLQTVAGQLALALQRADSEAATERMAGQMATLYDLGLETAALRDLRPLFVKAAEEAGRLIRADHSSVFRFDETDGRLRLFVAWGQDPGDRAPGYAGVRPGRGHRGPGGPRPRPRPS